MCELREEAREVIKNFCLALLIAALDGISKWLVVRMGVPYRVNDGGAFSILDHWPYFGSLITVLIGLLVGYLIWSRHHKLSRFEERGMVLLIGGGVGNFIDRLAGDGVVDFIPIVGSLSVNLADVAITAGLALILWETVAKAKIKTNGTESSV